MSTIPENYYAAGIQGRAALEAMSSLNSAIQNRSPLATLNLLFGQAVAQQESFLQKISSLSFADDFNRAKLESEPAARRQLKWMRSLLQQQQQIETGYLKVQNILLASFQKNPAPAKEAVQWKTLPAYDAAHQAGENALKQIQEVFESLTNCPKLMGDRERVFHLYQSSLKSYAGSLSSLAQIHFAEDFRKATQNGQTHCHLLNAHIEVLKTQQSLDALHVRVQNLIADPSGLLYLQYATIRQNTRCLADGIGQVADWISEHHVETAALAAAGAAVIIPEPAARSATLAAAVLLGTISLSQNLNGFARPMEKIRSIAASTQKLAQGMFQIGSSWFGMGYYTGALAAGAAYFAGYPTAAPLAYAAHAGVNWAIDKVPSFIDWFAGPENPRP